MIDIISQNPGEDMGIYDTQVEKAKNILSVQLGALAYDLNFGVDIKYFLSDNLRFQTESFKAYLIQVLANRGINVSSLITEKENLFETYVFNLAPEETSTGLIAR